MRLFAIALQRFPDRYRHAKLQTERFPALKAEIFGVDGRELSLPDCMSSDVPLLSMSPGQVGCAMSHIAVYRRMAELELPYAFVIEDDAILPADIEEIISTCLPHLSPRGVISLYSPRPSPTDYSDRGAPILPGGKLISPVSSLDTHTTTAYLIGREAAMGIASYNSPVRSLADHWFAFYAAGAIDRVLVYHPMPISVEPFDSSIGYRRGWRGAVKSLVTALPPVRRALKLRRVREEQRQKANIIVVGSPTFYDRKET